MIQKEVVSKDSVLLCALITSNKNWVPGKHNP